MKNKNDTHVWSRVFWHLMSISISLVQTDACNIISWSIFTGISLQPLHYSIQRGKQFSAMTRGALMESYSVTVVTTTWAWYIWCSTETGLVLLRGIRGHCKPTLFLPFPSQMPHQGYLMLWGKCYCRSPPTGSRKNNQNVDGTEDINLSR